MSQTLLTDLLTPDRIRVPLDAEDKPGLIDELCVFLATSCGVGPEEEAESAGAFHDTLRQAEKAWAQP